jgi:hypothetical protein
LSGVRNNRRIGWRDSSRIMVRPAFVTALAGDPPTVCWDRMFDRWPWPMLPRAIGILGVFIDDATGRSELRGPVQMTALGN